VAPARLRFAPDEPVARYLARFAVADLMIDTTPFGSHTTVNDALFMGLPVVTLAGRSFAARASGSQLHAIGRPELATRSLADYVDLARQLAGDRARLTDLRASLRDVRAAPLFAADDYAARFADAITQAWRARCR
jgi:predicted O-linked N-acetylglucosamine transferase (SPINDLY family)